MAPCRETERIAFLVGETIAHLLYVLLSVISSISQWKNTFQSSHVLCSVRGITTNNNEKSKHVISDHPIYSDI